MSLIGRRSSERGAGVGRRRIILRVGLTSLCCGGSSEGGVGTLRLMQRVPSQWSWRWRWRQVSSLYEAAVSTRTEYRILLRLIKVLTGIPNTVLYVSIPWFSRKKKSWKGHKTALNQKMTLVRVFKIDKIRKKIFWKYNLKNLSLKSLFDLRMSLILFHPFFGGYPVCMYIR